MDDFSTLFGLCGCLLVMGFIGLLLFVSTRSSWQPAKKELGGDGVKRMAELERRLELLTLRLDTLSQQVAKMAVGDILVRSAEVENATIKSAIVAPVPASLGAAMSNVEAQDQQTIVSAGVAQPAASSESQQQMVEEVWGSIEQPAPPHPQQVAAASRAVEASGEPMAATRSPTPSDARAGAPPPPPPLSALPSTPPAAPKPFDSERALVRVFTVGGGVLLGLAGIYFFKYGLDNDWFPPALRVIAGVLVGIAACGASEAVLRKRSALLANAVFGGGTVVLYSSIWAARTLYQFIDTPVAFAAMAAVTASAAVVASVRRAQTTAALGLLGGFLTPLLLSRGEDNPIGLFGYLLLLNVGLLIVAQRRRWLWLGGVSFLFTALYQAAWVLLRMRADNVLVGYVVLTVFLVLFGLFFYTLKSSFPAVPAKLSPLAEAVVAMLLALPLLGMLYLTLSPNLAPDFLPVTGYLGLLVFASMLVAPRLQSPLAGAIAAVSAAMLGLLGMLFRSGVETPVRDFSLGALLIGLGALSGYELHRRIVSVAPAGAEKRSVLGLGSVAAWAISALTAALACHTGTLAQPAASVGVLFLFALGAFRQSTVFSSRFPAVAAAVATGVLCWSLPAVNEPLWLLAPVIGFVALFMLAATPSAAWNHARQFSAASVVLTVSTCVLALMLPWMHERLLLPWVSTAFALLLVAALTVESSRVRSAFLYAVAAFFFAASRVPVRALRSEFIEAFEFWPGGALVLWAGSLTLVAFALLARQRYKNSGALFLLAVLTPVLPWAISQQDFQETWPLAPGAWPLCFAVIEVGALLFVHARIVSEQERRNALAAFSAGALAFLSAAFPLQFENQWLTIAWALEGTAVILVWTRLRHVGLKYFGLVLLSAVFVRLVLNPWVLEYHPRSAIPIFNWLTYTYWVPTVCLFVACSVLIRDELAHQSRWESVLYTVKRPLIGLALGVMGLLTFFVWLNLSVFDYFSTEAFVSIDWSRSSQRDLTLSFSWIAYALVLLALGMWRKSVGLRWSSLILLLFTVGKLFLYDLGGLKDLYRVASIAGLAISLMVVALAYQRFVFGASSSNPVKEK
jgi:uncharacterized membrane protein